MEITREKNYVKFKLKKIYRIKRDIDYALLDDMLKNEYRGKPFRVSECIEKLDIEKLKNMGFSCVYNYYRGDWKTIKVLPTTFDYVIINSPFKRENAKLFKKELKQIIFSLAHDCAKRMPDEFNKKGFSDWTSFPDKYLILFDNKKIISFIGFDKWLYSETDVTLWEIFVDTQYRNTKLFPTMLGLIKKHEVNAFKSYIIATDSSLENKLNQILLKNKCKLYRQTWKNSK